MAKHPQGRPRIEKKASSTRLTAGHRLFCIVALPHVGQELAQLAYGCRADLGQDAREVALRIAGPALSVLLRSPIVHRQA